ncbi:MAG: hypothetical protein A3F09_01880 [Chlamydiae bacterium RIFCSPHIGHO2_12_FULL_49_11]|nr:MAG: hypothetical protein A3F09_01880 [Chlamydiae bacterium RIFCSPHIGHO2_12_FULL_49_11]
MKLKEVINIETIPQKYGFNIILSRPFGYHNIVLQNWILRQKFQNVLFLPGIHGKHCQNALLLT